MYCKGSNLNPSWETEYTNKANSHQEELARALIDAGADMIVGSHLYWVQSFGLYKEVLNRFVEYTDLNNN
jgi:poly-gamma-glutamate capsule biosynthesis protein CapA/YwtB (metallophosphatase superfamily)